MKQFNENIKYLVLNKGLLINGEVTPLADEFAQALGLLTVVARPAEVPACVLHKAQVSQLHVAQLTAEAARMPVGVHGLDHAADDKLTTESAAWSEQHLEVVFTVLPALKLIEEPLGKRPEALCTHKAVLMVELPITVDDALCGGKPGLAPLAHGIRQTF